jgi:hypothetical protein
MIESHDLSAEAAVAETVFQILHHATAEFSNNEAQSDTCVLFRLLNEEGMKPVCPKIRPFFVKCEEYQLVRMRATGRTIAEGMN